MAGDVAWLPGAWVGARGSSSIEECWSPPLGGTMLGASRTVSRERRVAFEFLRIVERDGGLVYVAQPNGAPPTGFVLVERNESRAVFVNPRDDSPPRIMYEKSNDGRSSAPIGHAQGGKPTRFGFTREGGYGGADAQRGADTTSGSCRFLAREPQALVALRSRAGRSRQPVWIESRGEIASGPSSAVHPPAWDPPALFVLAPACCRLSVLVLPCVIAACASVTSRGSAHPVLARDLHVVGEAPAAEAPAAEAQPVPAVTGPVDANVAAVPSVAAQDDEWRFNAMLFGWLVGIEGTFTHDALAGTIDEGFDDLVDNLNGAAMGSFVARHGRFGVQTDFTWARLDASDSGRFTTVDTEIEMFLGEIDFLYSPESAPGLDFLLGARVLDLQLDLQVGAQPRLADDQTNVDPVVGAQGQWQLGEDWRFGVRGDIGGFGAASELTYQALGLFRWNFAEAWGLDFGYRLIGYRIRSGDASLDLDLHGPVIGVDFAF
jgi:hypothetical protein